MTSGECVMFGCHDWIAGSRESTVVVDGVEQTIRYLLCQRHIDKSDAAKVRAAGVPA